MIKLKFLLKNSSCLPRFSFSRKVKDSGTLKERQISHQDSKEVDTIDEHKYSERMDPLSKEVDDDFLSHCRLNAQHLPERLLKRIHQIFSKYRAKDVRDYAAEYLKLYRALNATEKPMLDYNKAKPFANTEQILESNPDLFYLRNKNINSSEMEEKIAEKRQEKEKKKASADKPISKLVEDNKKREEVIPTIEYTQNMALGYLLKKMPNTFVVACRVFTEIKYRLPELNPKNFLDFGAGMGIYYYIITF